MCLARDPSGRLQIPPHDKPIKGESFPTMPPRAAPVKHIPNPPRLICSTSGWRDGSVSEGVSDHAQVVEDEAGIALEAAHGGGDAVVGVRTDDADGEAAQSGGVFGAVPGADAGRSSSKALSRMSCTASTVQCPQLRASRRSASAVSGEWLVMP